MFPLDKAQKKSELDAQVEAFLSKGGSITPVAEDKAESEQRKKVSWSKFQATYLLESKS